MKKQLYTLLGLVTIFFSSCLKDDRLILDPAKTKNIIEFANSSNIVKAGTTTAMFTHALSLTPDGSVTFEVSYSGAEKEAPQDIKVDIGIGTDDILTQYNTENKTTYLPLPTSMYSLSTSSVTIPKGKKRAAFTMSFKPTMFDISKLYAFPLVIKSSSYGIISANFSKILININAKNKYDGVYDVEALSPMKDLISSTLTGLYPMEQELRTRTANSVAEWDQNYWAPYSYYHPIRSSGNPSVYGNFSPVFIMNDNEEVIAVENYYGQGNNANGRAARLDPSGVNKWTLVGGKRTLEVKYVMIQNDEDRTFFHEKWTFKQMR
ncbi:DUF1735 domain-containing protein [Pedobacter sp. Hv1]|uniref:DUF1735 domain-containing protein n=1 Tax=Pedobacter sp. Hv1 TaxID=1740090 RepID=UPI0006D8C37F|nr:DUF1735 domain-containing protein [Pedobacter sp. Hv1]KQB99434.1 hypothetical protein AQF98_17855 [Pedobacter sp. Hv1]